jgi:hypothetical protein
MISSKPKVEKWIYRYCQYTDFSDVEWKTFTDFVEKLTHYHPHLCGGDGYDFPVITENNIMFNGNADTGDVVDAFFVSKNKIPNKIIVYCNTGKKSYDTAVVACLIHISFFTPHILSITSDAQMHQWADGLELCKIVSNEKNILIPELS